MSGIVLIIDKTDSVAKIAIDSSSAYKKKSINLHHSTCKYLL